MPQLPSGLFVALTIDPALKKAREGHSFFRAIFKVQVKSADDIDQAISILYHRPKEGTPYPGEPYLSGITVNAIGTDRCDWSQADIESFRQWLATDNTQQWLRTAYDNIIEVIRNSKSVLPENLKGIMDDEDENYPVFGTGAREEELPESVVTLIGELIKRDNVQSVSCPFNNSKVWRLLVDEQVCRAKLTGLPNQKAFALSGPDGGLACIPSEWGGDVHIPYEGACMGDLFVLPEWRNLFIDKANKKGERAALGDYIAYWNDPERGDSCHYLLMPRDIGELSCAHRQIVGDGWFLYESNRPYVKVKMLGLNR